MDINIEIFDEDNKKYNKIKKPLDYITVGSIKNDDIEIYIHNDIYINIDEYSSRNTSIEVGSILIGNYSINSNERFIIISDFIEAKYSNATASRLTFTHDSWNYIYSEYESKYSDKKIIGWHHTHPSYGIFLSSYDMFIQQNFFNLEFQIAYVVDPISKTRGFFQWKNNHIEKLQGFFVYY